MPLNIEKLDRKRLAAFLAILLVVILFVLALARPLDFARAGRSDPSSGCCRPTKFVPVVTGANYTYGHLCGHLIYLVDDMNPTIKTTGLLPCGGGKPMIFKVHPRDNIPYFQFRNVSTHRGSEICDKVYGCLDTYITSFQNYIGIDSCQMCGIANLPPTWTHAPLTPYTFTPVPPTPTLYIPSQTPTDTPSPTLGTVTNTPNLFEILKGTATPGPSPTEALALAPTAAPATAPTQSAARRLPAVCGSLLAPLLLILVYLFRSAGVSKKAG